MSEKNLNCRKKENRRKIEKSHITDFDSEIDILFVNKKEDYKQKTNDFYAEQDLDIIAEMHDNMKKRMKAIKKLNDLKLLEFLLISDQEFLIKGESFLRLKELCIINKKAKKILDCFRGPCNFCEHQYKKILNDSKKKINQTFNWFCVQRGGLKPIQYYRDELERDTYPECISYKEKFTRFKVDDYYNVWKELPDDDDKDILIIKNDSKNIKYYHATIHTTFNLKKIKPAGYYEKVKNDDCPQPLFGDIGAGFPISDILETCFSKSIAGSIIGAINTQCVENREYLLDIYETKEEPDIDLSDCPYDFSILEEVRYRRKIYVKKTLTIKAKKELVNQVQIEAYGKEEGGGVNELYLECIKEDIERQLQFNNKVLKKIDPQLLKICIVRKCGMSLDEYEQHMNNCYFE